VAFAPSGNQFEIAWEDLRATVVEVGGGLRALSAGARPLVEAYRQGALCDGAHGAILAPWPNRLEDGRYSVDGREYQLDLSEPDRHNAIHGLVRWRSWQAVRHEPHRVVVAVRLHPTPGYPFALDLSADYTLGPEGLRVSVTATNQGTQALPYALGQHPYLFPGEGGVDAARLTLRARTHLLADPERRVPVAREATRGTALDYGAGRAIGSGRLDDAFTDLERDEGGRAWVRLEGDDGRVVELWQDASFPYLQVYTGEELAPERRRRALAVEPMTAPANALRSGEGLLRLGPGERHTAAWGLRLV
jgi:aldose 1-epimerase